MDTKTAIALALGLGRMDTDALDEWARAWEQDITPGLVEDAIGNNDGRIDAAGDWLFGEIARRGARSVADELGIVMDGPDWEANDEGRDFLHALNIYENASGTTVHFGGDNYKTDVVSIWGREDLLDAARAWMDARAA